LERFDGPNDPSVALKKVITTPLKIVSILNSHLFNRMKHKKVIKLANGCLVTCLLKFDDLGTVSILNRLHSCRRTDFCSAVLVGSDRLILRYNKNTFKFVDSIEAHSRVVHCMIAVDKRIWSCSSDQTIKLWDPKVTISVFGLN